jgi:hypothetical protein
MYDDSIETFASRMMLGSAFVLSRISFAAMRPLPSAVGRRSC